MLLCDFLLAVVAALEHAFQAKLHAQDLLSSNATAQVASQQLQERGRGIAFLLGLQRVWPTVLHDVRQHQAGAQPAHGLRHGLPEHFAS